MRGTFGGIPRDLRPHLWSNITLGGEQILRKVSAPPLISLARFRGSIIFYTAADVQRASLRGPRRLDLGAGARAGAERRERRGCEFLAPEERSGD